MRLPRFWRLWSRPRLGSYWRCGDAPARRVWYFEGAPGREWVVCMSGSSPRRCTLSDFRRWWVFAEEVRLAE